MKQPNFLEPQEDQTFFDNIRKPTSCKEPVFWDRPTCDIVAASSSPTPEQFVANIPEEQFREGNLKIKIPRRSL
jgi:hypothetical protein